MEAFPDRQQNLLSALQRCAIPLATVEAGSGFHDLQALKPAISNARIVAMGEATHGTREIFQLKHRLVEYLVTEMGFTSFAIEANWPECLAVNDYVVHGRGDPATALAGLRCWPWNTEEVLAMILWMRRHNEVSATQGKVVFVGFDAQFTSLAASSIRQYLTRVDPDFALAMAPRLSAFETECRNYEGWSEADVDGIRSTISDLAERLRTEEQGYVARASIEEWREAFQHVRVLGQVDEQRRADNDQKERYLIRDRAMAENIAWLLEEQGPHSKMAVWAHNAHVARDPRGIFDGAVVSMGMHLARQYPSELVVVGFAFGEGGFGAVVVEEEGDRRSLREAVVGPATDESMDAVLAQNGVPVFLLDFRNMSSDLSAWLERPRITREIGAFFTDPDDMYKTIVPMARYDVLAFIAHTTGARRNLTKRDLA